MRYGLFAAAAAVMLIATMSAAQPKDKDKDEDEDAQAEKEEKPKKKDKKGDKGDKKGDKGKDEDEDEEKEGSGSGMMEQTGRDPAETETADKPEPKKKPKVKVQSTGKVKVEEEESPFLPPRKPLRLLGELLIGFGGTPLPGPVDEEEGLQIDGTVFTLRVGGSYDFSKKFTLGLLIPWSTGTVNEPSSVGAERIKRNTSAFGAPLITATIRSPLGKNTTVPWGLAIGIPIAQGNPDILGTDTAGQAQLELNMLADANSGWRDGELFHPKRLPVVPFVGIDYGKGRIEAGAFAKIAFLFNVGGEITNPNVPGLSGGTIELNSVAMRTVVGAGAKYWFLKSPMMFGGLDLWAVHNTIRPVTFKSGDSDEPNPIQFVIEPRVGMRFGSVVPSAGFVLPLGGDLGDHDAMGLRLGVDGSF